MDYSVIVAALSGILVGIIAALKVIAPLTKNKLDDKVLEYAEKADAVLVTIRPAPGAQAVVPAK